MKGKILIAVIVTVSMGLATLNVYSQKDGDQKKYVERVYEPGNFSKNFNRLSPDELADKRLTFNVRGVYKEGTTQSDLANALTISDLISEFSTKVKTFKTIIQVADAQQTNKRIANGTDENLTAEQIALIKSANLEDEVTIVVNFNATNVINGKVEERELHIRLTVIPEIEAEYATGNDELVNYLEEYSNSILTQEMKDAFQFAYVEFVVNETGGIEDVRMNVSTEYENIDKQLMDFVERMPEWKPAQNGQGEFVKQRFEFSISTNLNGC